MIGRPEAAETAAYYFGYINRVAGENPQAAMREQLDESLTLFSSITEEKSFFRYAPEKWSIRQALNHVTDTERAFVFRALWFARGFDAPLPGFDPDIAAAGAGADATSWAAHIEEFRQVRLATIAFFANLPADAWMRTGTASGNPFTVRALAFIVPGHVNHHLAILRERYL